MVFLIDRPVSGLCILDPPPPGSLKAQETKDVQNIHWFDRSVYHTIDIKPIMGEKKRFLRVCGANKDFYISPMVPHGIAKEMVLLDQQLMAKMFEGFLLAVLSIPLPPPPHVES